MKIEELGNNRFKIEDKIIYAPNISVALDRYYAKIKNKPSKQSGYTKVYPRL